MYKSNFNLFKQKFGHFEKNYAIGSDPDYSNQQIIITERLFLIDKNQHRKSRL